MISIVCYLYFIVLVPISIYVWKRHHYSNFIMYEAYTCVEYNTYYILKVICDLIISRDNNFLW